MELNFTPNMSEGHQLLINKSMAVDPSLIDKFIYNRAFDQPTYDILIVMYAILIIIGAFGNILVIMSVIRRPTMRTPRNMFIVNLAISDLLLCTITMPLTLAEILTKYFPFGNHPMLCKMISPLQAISIFVSTISITAIALDRYQVIVYPTMDSLQLSAATVIIVMIWMIAVVLASPLFIFKKLEHHDFPLHGVKDIEIDYCFEDWPFHEGRVVYSILSLIFQYMLTIVLVSTAYLKIYLKLRSRFAAGFVSQGASSAAATYTTTVTTVNPDTQQRTAQPVDRRELRGRRLQRTNILLMSITVIFFVSWLPINMFNLVADMCSTCMDHATDRVRITYAACHMFGMSSACSNPILYGWLNENFCKEFREMMCSTVTQAADAAAAAAAACDKINSRHSRNSRTRSGGAVNGGAGGSQRSNGSPSGVGDGGVAGHHRKVEKQELVTEFNANTISANTEMSLLSRC